MRTLLAVETSDIVGSTKLTHVQLSSAIALLKNTHAELLSNAGGSVEYFRGDAFQVIYKAARTALKLALLLHLQLRFQLETPIFITQSIYVGESNYTHNASSTQDISLKMDTPFIESGRQLDKMQKGELSLGASFLSKDFTLCAAFFNRILKSLSIKQSEVLYWYILLNFPEQKVVADKLNMTRQNVNTHLIRANADLVKRFLSQYDENIRALGLKD